jgi:aminodeoxyfutalosine synthase
MQVSAETNLSIPAVACSAQVDVKAISDPSLKPLADKLAQGIRLDLDDGLALLRSQDLLGLSALAHAARVARWGLDTFYVVNQHLNYTNICGNQCAFCAYWREPEASDAYALSPAQAAAQVAAHPADELHIVGGCHPDLPLEYYQELLAELARVQPGATLKAFTAVEIDHLAKANRLEPAEVISRLKKAGLAAMPGGGAEIFAPRVRARLCARKADGPRWLEISGLAHQQGIFTNATMLYGHIETRQERAEHLLALREQQDRTGGFSAFVPLAFHPAHTKLAQRPGPSGLEDLQVIAASRLLLDNIPHIKAYWVMLGAKLASLALNFGADDLDGTIVEERITHAAGASTARGMTQAEIRHLITSAGFRPVRRDGLYNSLESES